jgi:N6-adenosine-specific RNA methylase IME4
MSETKCEAKHPKNRETCTRPTDHVGMHHNGGNVTWKKQPPAPPCEEPSAAVAPHICANAVRDASTGKPIKGANAKACEREFGHEGVHRIGPTGDLEFVTEWNDEVAGCVSYNRKAVQPLTGKTNEEHKAEDALDDRVLAMIVAKPGRTAPQIGRRYSKAIARLEADGRIEWINEGWHPAAARSITLADEPEEVDELDDLDMRTLARQQREAREVHAAEVEAAPIAASSTLKVHPAADALPLIEGAEFDALVADIKANGQRHKIVLDHSGEWLVDGRNRRRACEQLGITPQCERLEEGANIAAYVISTNLNRRHLDATQRAALASEIANLSQGQKQTRPGAGLGPSVTQAQAAALAGVGERTVQRANAVRDNAVPELWAAVKSGKVDLKGAEQVSKLSPKQQRDLIKNHVDPSKGPVRGGKLAAHSRQEKKRETVRDINSGKVRPMPVGQFGVIYVDYPWFYENSDQHDSARGHMPYPGMKMEAILAHAREASKRAGKDCVIALWTTNVYAPRVGQVIDAYGAVERTMLTWPKPRMGMGPKFSRSQTEHLVIATIGNPVHTLNEISTLLPEYATREHSRKPAEVAELLQKHCSGPFLELFAQEDERERPNWTLWGAEVGKFETEAA